MSVVKRLFFISLSLVFIIFMLTACPSVTPDNQPPTIELSPVDDIVTETLPYDVTVGATATDNRGIRKVEFSLYKDGTLVDGPISKTTAAHGSYYTHTFSITAYGNYEVRARAQDVGNNWSETVSDDFVVRAQAVNHPPTITSIVWNAQDIVQGKMVARNGVARFTVNYSDPDNNVVKIVVIENGGASATFNVSNQNSQYIEYSFTTLGTKTGLTVRVVDESDLYAEEKIENIYVLDSSRGIEISFGDFSLKPGINLIPVIVRNWKDGAISGTIDLYMARGAEEYLKGTADVEGFIEATVTVPIALINLGSNDQVSLWVRYTYGSGSCESERIYEVIAQDTNPPVLNFRVPQIIAEGEPLQFTIHAEDQEILEALTNLKIKVYPDVQTGGSKYLSQIAEEISTNTSPVFVRYRIKIEGRAWNQLGYEVNPHTSWVEIRRRGTDEWATSTDYFHEWGEFIPYVIHEIDRSREPSVTVEEIAEQFDATITVYVDFVTTKDGQIDGAVDYSNIVDAFLESGERYGQGWEYEIEVEMKDWTDRPPEAYNSEHFDVEEDDERPVLEIWAFRRSSGDWENVTGENTVDLWVGDQLYVVAKDNISLHNIMIDLVSTTATFVDTFQPQPSYTDNDWVFSYATKVCFSDDPAVPPPGVDPEKYDPDWVKMHKEYQLVYEAPDTPFATFILKVYTTDRSTATNPGYVPSIGVQSHSELDSEASISKLISVRTRCLKTYTMFIKEEDMVSYPTETWYRHYRYVLKDDDIYDDFELYPSTLTREYELKWPEYESGNVASDLKLPIIGGPNARNTNLAIMVTKDTDRVDVYLLKGLFPDTGSLVASGIDFNNPEHIEEYIRRNLVEEGIVVASLTIQVEDDYTGENFGKFFIPDPSREEGVADYANKDVYVYWWRLNAGELETAISTSGTYTFVVIPKHRTYANMWAICETAEFPFIYDGSAPISGAPGAYGAIYPEPHASPVIILYKSPSASTTGPDMGSFYDDVEPYMPESNPEKLPATVTLEIIDDFAGFYVDGNTAAQIIEDLRKQIHFEARAYPGGGDVDTYPIDGAARSFSNVYSSGSYEDAGDGLWINGHPAARFYALNVRNHLWHTPSPLPSSKKYLFIKACDELNNCGTWWTWAGILSCEVEASLTFDIPPGWPPSRGSISATNSATYIAYGDYATLTAFAKSVCDVCEDLGCSTDIGPVVTHPATTLHNTPLHVDVLDGLLNHTDLVELTATLDVMEAQCGTTDTATACAAIDTLFCKIGRPKACEYSNLIPGLTVLGTPATFTITATDAEATFMILNVSDSTPSGWSITATESASRSNSVSICNNQVTLKYEMTYLATLSGTTNPSSIATISVNATAVDVMGNMLGTSLLFIVDTATPIAAITIDPTDMEIDLGATDNYMIAHVEFEHSICVTTNPNSIDEDVLSKTYHRVVNIPDTDYCALHATFTVHDLGCNSTEVSDCASIDTIGPNVEDAVEATKVSGSVFNATITADVVDRGGVVATDVRVATNSNIVINFEWDASSEQVSTKTNDACGGTTYTATYLIPITFKSTATLGGYNSGDIIATVTIYATDVMGNPGSRSFVITVP